MNENIIRTISSEMNRYLNNYQMSKLQEVLYKKVEIEKKEISNDEYLNNRMDNNAALFVSNNKPYDRLQSTGIELMLQKLGKELGEEKVHPHKFRRTLATKAIDKGMPIEQVQHLLGHTKIDTTLHYAFANQNNVKISHRKYIY